MSPVPRPSLRVCDCHDHNLVVIAIEDHRIRISFDGARLAVREGFGNRPGSAATYSIAASISAANPIAAPVLRFAYQSNASSNSSRAAESSLMAVAMFDPGECFGTHRFPGNGRRTSGSNGRNPTFQLRSPCLMERKVGVGWDRIPKSIDQPKLILCR
jgi:hypothetical protein